MNGEPRLTADQLAQLRRLAEATDGLRMSNRNTPGRIATGTAGAFYSAGLVRFDRRGGGVQTYTQVLITDAGRAALGHNVEHVPPKISDTPAFHRGLDQAAVDRRTGIRELQDVLDAELALPAREQNPVRINGARAALERLRASEAEDQERQNR